MEQTFATQKAEGTTPEKSDQDATDILLTYQAIREQRKKMDELLERLYREKKAGPASSEEHLKQSMFANTLWVILASCLIWYAVVEM